MAPSAPPDQWALLLCPACASEGLAALQQRGALRRPEPSCQGTGQAMAVAPGRWGRDRENQRPGSLPGGPAAACAEQLVRV